MIVNRHVDRLFIFLLPIGIFVFFSVRPVMRLKADPPPEFLQPDPAWNAKRRAMEDELARGFWKSATGVVQWEYGFGATLPQSVPQDFRIEESGLHTGGLENDPATRARYWARFRQVWRLPHCWERSYGWDVSWIPRSLTAFHDWFIDNWQRIFWKG